MDVKDARDDDDDDVDDARRRDRSSPVRIALRRSPEGKEEDASRSMVGNRGVVAVVVVVVVVGEGWA